jgi:outer membrane protein assembly factor BamB
MLLMTLLLALLVTAGCAFPPYPGSSRPDHRPIRQTPPSSPLASQTVYWSQNTWLTALRVSDGKPRWQIGHQWAASADGKGAFTYGPLAATLADGSLYALGIDDHNSAAVYAFATRDGTIRWQLPVTGCLAIPMEPPLVVDGVVYVSLTGHFSGDVGCKPTGWVYALRASDGHILWHVPFTQSVWPTLALTDGVLVVANSTDNKYPATSWLTGLRASDGKQLWRITRATDKIEFAADDGQIIIKRTAGIRYDSGLKVEALRASDGTRLWASAVIPSSDPEYFMDPLLANGAIYIFSASGTLYALRASDGREAWRYQTGARSVGTPVAANGRLYMGVGSTFDVLDATSGTLLSAHLLFDPSAASNDANYVWSAPVVTDSVIFVSAGLFDCPPGFLCRPDYLDGHLYALDTLSGKVLWQYQAPQGQQVTTPMLGV